MIYTYNENAFNSSQKRIITYAIRNRINKEIFSLLTSVNKKNEPIFDSDCMNRIVSAVYGGLTNSQILLFSKINSSEKPIFDCSQMGEIASGFNYGLSEKEVKIYARIKNEKPLFTSDQMSLIKKFLYEADKEHVQALEDCINEGLNYDDINCLLDCEIPTENIRIYRQMVISNILPVGFPKSFLEKYSYDDLKKIKYCCECANKLGVTTNLTCINEILRSKPFNYNALLETICNNAYYKHHIMNSNCRSILCRCMQYEMPPEQIEVIANVASYGDEIDTKDTAIAYLNGFTADQIDKIINKYGYENNMIEIQDLLNIMSIENSSFIKQEYRTDFFEDIGI